MRRISPEFNKMIGKPLDMEKIEDLHQGPIRVWEPDTMGTMDYRPERLNVHVDEKKIVKSFRHG